MSSQKVLKENHCLSPKEKATCHLHCSLSCTLSRTGMNVPREEKTARCSWCGHVPATAPRPPRPERGTETRVDPSEPSRSEWGARVSPVCPASGGRWHQSDTLALTRCRACPAPLSPWFLGEKPVGADSSRALSPAQLRQGRERTGDRQGHRTPHSRNHGRLTPT